MNAKELYQKLETDFELANCRDDWKEMDFNEFVTENFKGRQMGLVLDNTEEIKKVYTAVFPSDKVLQEILATSEKNILLFTHHPMVWDTNLSGFPFKNINLELLSKLKENNISLYTLHVPLDKNGEYSTTVNYAKALGISWEESFAEYFGVQAGVIGKCSCQTIEELAEKAKALMGHEIRLFSYGEKDIKDQKIAVVAGGGNDASIIKELITGGIKNFVTGVVRKSMGYPPAIEFDRLAKENKINVIGATHYSTEKFACIAITKYFEKLGFSAKFIKDDPDFGDLD